MANFGIDFGTTNSTLCCYSKGTGKKYIGDNKKIDEPLPSIVAINKNDGNIIVGKDVKDRIKSLEDEYYVVLSIKTILNDENKEWKIGNQTYKPVDVAAQILKALKENAKQRYIGFDLSSAVISVPVNFEASKKQKLKQAAEKAGIKITKFISEPTAAYMAHYVELSAFSEVIVFDWGGGTLDISALKIEDASIQEIYTDNLYKAGDNIDKSLAKLIYEKSLRKQSLELIPFERLKTKDQDELTAVAERAKIKLSKEGVDTVTEMLTVQEKTFRIDITYEELCAVSEDLINEAIEKLTNVIGKSSFKEIGCILCVGGSCNLRLLREKLKILWGMKVYFPDQPEWDIADGACTIDAAPDETGKYMLADDIKLGLSNGEWLTLLSKGQPVPTQEAVFYLSTVDCTEAAKFIFKTNACNEEHVLFPVLGGIDEVLKLSVYIDDFSVFHACVETNKEKTEYEIFIGEKIDLCYHLEG